MWIMIVLSSYFSEGGMSDTRVRTTPTMVAVEFSSRDRCIAAVQFTKQQPQIYNAFCVQK